MNDSDDLNPFLENSLATQIDVQTVVDALGEIREGYIARELKAREEKCCEFTPLTLALCTWNVNSYLPDSPLDLLYEHLFSGAEKAPHIVAIGLQEFNVSADAYLYTDTLRESAWNDAILAQLNKKGSEYSKVASKQLSSLLIILFAANSVIGDISDISSASVGTGMLGLGNKGGVSLRFKFCDSYFTLVNTHLPADSSQVERRNQDFVEVAKRTRFPTLQKDYKQWALKHPFVPTWRENMEALNDKSPAGRQLFTAFKIASGSGRSGVAPVNYATIFDSDHVFWFGDLNYRIALPDKRVREIIATKNYDQLLEKDQLFEQQKNGLAFVQFLEAPISFPPTYKFDVGTSVYDTSEKKRVPSWCDRILYFATPLRFSVASANASQIASATAVKPSITLSPESLVEDSNGAVANKPWVKFLSYSSIHDCVNSDHKPVFAVAETLVRRVNAAALEQATISISRELDKFENESVPSLEISSQSIQLQAPDYMVPLSYTIELVNRGKVPTCWFFVPKPGETRICKPFCWVEPTRGVIKPNQILKIQFSVLIDAASVTSLNTGQETLDDILILHIENGRDHFVLLQGEYKPTCFGLDLQTLLLLESSKNFQHCCIKGFTPAEIGALSTTLKPQSPLQQSTPRVLSQLLEALETVLQREKSIADSLFSLNGDPFVLQYIAQCLDFHVPFDFDYFCTFDSAQPQESEADSASRKVLETKYSIAKPKKLPNAFQLFSSSISETLIRLLQALPQPIVPASVASSLFAVNWDSMADVSARVSDAWAFLKKELEPFHGHYAALELLVKFLKFLVELDVNPELSVLPVNRIVGVLASAIMPGPSVDQFSNENLTNRSVEQESAKIKFLNMLVNYCFQNSKA